VRERTLWRPGILIVLALWAVSLALPAMSVEGGPVLRGIDVLRRGWQASDAGVYAWFANPLFLAACAAGWRGLRGPAFVLAGAACVLALTSFATRGVAAASGAAVPVFVFHAGFYLWLATHFAMLLSCLPRRVTAPS